MRSEGLHGPLRRPPATRIRSWSVSGSIVVPAFDVGKEREVDPRQGPVGLAVRPLRLQRSEEALAHGVVVAGGHPTDRTMPTSRHRWPNMIDAY